MNMSYCRFHNALIDFEDCEGVLQDLLNGERPELSPEEMKKAVKLIAHAKTLVMDFAEKAGKEVEDLQESDIDEVLHDCVKAPDSDDEEEEDDDIQEATEN